MAGLSQNLIATAYALFKNDRPHNFILLSTEQDLSNVISFLYHHLNRSHLLTKNGRKCKLFFSLSRFMKTIQNKIKLLSNSKLQYLISLTAFNIRNCFSIFKGCQLLQVLVYYKYLKRLLPTPKIFIH